MSIFKLLLFKLTIYGVIASDIIAIPVHPESIADFSLFLCMPPSPYTGMLTEEATSFTNCRPLGAKSFLQSVLNM